MASEKITAMIEEVKTLTVLELAELVHALEEEFGLGEMSEDDIASIVTVGDLYKYMQDHLDL